MQPQLGLAVLLVLAGCSRGNEASLRQLLEEDRRAHLETDADLIADHLADTLISVADGRVTLEPREQARAFFRSYFSGARYLVWEDVVPPVVHVAPDGRSAWVIRQVRAERDEPGLGGRTLRRAFSSAWTATYAWRDGRWQMTTVASTFVPDSPADRILAGAARATGIDRPGRVETITAAADAAGPGTTFQVTVTSHRSGAARIVFSSGLDAGLSADSTWWQAPGQAPALLDPDRESFVRGHELHMALLAPASRVRDPAFTGEVDFAGTRALRVSGVDLSGAPVDLFFGAADTVPLGMRVDDRLRGAGPVTTTVSDWIDLGGRRLFQRAEFRQGAETFRYRFTGIEAAGPGA